MKKMLDLRCDPDDPEGLRREICRRDKIIQSLMYQVEHSLDAIGTDYALLRDTCALEVQVHSRTDMLTQLLKTLENARAETEVARHVAQASNEAKSLFLANMSHEIRTPMNAILGITHLMRKDGVTIKQALQLNQIQSSSEHLLSIINDILDISKIEAGKLSLEEKDISLEEIVKKVVTILNPLVLAKGLQLTLDTPSSSYILRCDPTRLTQAILNYANNAIKFTDNGSITLGFHVLEETSTSISLKVLVTDTGIGIAPDVLDRLFSAFEQADASTTRDYGGTGLGLVITKKLAQLMGGDAGANSTQGVGSSFWFTAQLEKGTSQSHSLSLPEVQDSAEAEILREYRGQRILLVEDEPINQMIAIELLGNTGLVIETADDGAIGIEKARENSYALILMDMQMPKVNGLDATKQIRQFPGRENIPIIAMTANVFAQDMDRCLSAGMSDFLAKPVNPQHLYTTVLRWLRQAGVASSRSARSDSSNCSKG